MDIHNKLDQFIKSARFILAQRDFQKQAVYPNLGGVRYYPNLGLQNAAAFQRGVNLNPPVKRTPSRPSQPYRPSQYEQQREASGLNSKGWKMWCQLMDKAKTPKQLQQMQQVAPQLIGHMPDYQQRLNYGMKRAIERINAANGTNYSWNGNKLNLGNKTTNPNSNTGIGNKNPSMQQQMNQNYVPLVSPNTAPNPSSGDFLSPASLERSMANASGISEDTLADYKRPATLPGMPSKYKSTMTWNKDTGYDLGQPVTQSAYNDARAEYNNLQKYWGGLPEELRSNPKNFANYNKRVEQLKEFGRAYKTYQKNIGGAPNMPSTSTAGTAKPTKPDYIPLVGPNTVPNMPSAPAPKRTMPTAASSYGYGAPSSSVSAAPTFRPRPSKPSGV